jgi:hypothetical protein
VKRKWKGEGKGGGTGEIGAAWPGVGATRFFIDLDVGARGRFDSSSLDRLGHRATGDALKAA